MYWSSLARSSYSLIRGLNVLRINASARAEPVLITGALAEAEVGATIQLPPGGSGVNLERQRKPHPHSAFIDPTGMRVLVSELGTDQITSYTIDTVSGRLRENSIFTAAPGSGPRHLCFHPSGRWFYSINELDCTIVAVAYDPATGRMGPVIHSVSTLPAGYNNHDHARAKNVKGEPASGPNSPPGQTNTTADVHCTPCGRFVYGSNRGHDSLVCFSVADDGRLKLVGWTWSGGEHPRNFGIHPSGRWLVCANQDTDNVVVFSIDTKTGALKPTGVELTDVSKPRCVKWARC